MSRRLPRTVEWACIFSRQSAPWEIGMGFKEIGKRIQHAREEKGLTQVELAQSLGITQAGLSNYELGKRRLYLHQVEQIAKILGKDIEYFTGAEDGIPSDRSADLAPPRDRVIRRIMAMSDEDIRSVSVYLDFLAWRKNHD